MTDEREALMAALQASSARTQRADMQALWNDFKFVLRRWRETGEMSEEECANAYRAMSEVIRDHAGDNEWTRACAGDFAQMAGAMRQDMERSQRIAAEVRAGRVRKAACRTDDEEIVS